MLIDDLRLATEAQHRRTEAALDLDAACASPTSYASLLAAFLRLFRPLEARIDRVAGLDPLLEWPSRRRSALLVRDLAFLGAGADVGDDPNVAAIPLDDAGAAMGALYVTEGSTLGGQFIRKHVARSLGYSADAGCAFFTGYGPDTARRWRAFADVVNRHGDRQPQVAAAACESATRTFEVFERAMRERAIGVN